MERVREIYGGLDYLILTVDGKTVEVRILTTWTLVLGLVMQLKNTIKTLHFVNFASNIA